MQPRSSRAFSPILPAVLFALASLGVVAAVQAKTFSKSFDVTAGGQLIVDSDVGSIEVRSGSGNRVEIEITTSGSAEDRFEPSFSQDGNQVTVLGKYRRGSWLSWFDRARVEIVARVPERFDVELETAGGSISVDDLEGEVLGKTSGGSLRFGNIRGPVQGNTSGGSIQLESSVGPAHLHTSGGSIRIGDVDGDVRAETSGGSIRIERARGSVDAETSGGTIRVLEVTGAIRASTSGGGIEATLTEQPQGDCRLTTSGGSITARLATNLAFDVEAHASGGGVRTDLPIEAERKSRGTLIGQMNSGGPELYLRTSGGRIEIVGR